MTITLPAPKTDASEKCIICVGEKIIGSPCITDRKKECSLIVSKTKTCSIEKAFNAFKAWSDEQEYI